MIIFGVIQVHKVVPTWNEALAKNGSPKKRSKHGEDHVGRSGIWKPYSYKYIWFFKLTSAAIQFSHTLNLTNNSAPKNGPFAQKERGKKERFRASMFTGFQMFCFRAM